MQAKVELEGPSCAWRVFPMSQEKGTQDRSNEFCVRLPQQPSPGSKPDIFGPSVTKQQLPGNCIPHDWADCKRSRCGYGGGRNPSVRGRQASSACTRLPRAPPWRQRASKCARTCAVFPPSPRWALRGGHRWLWPRVWTKVDVARRDGGDRCATSRDQAPSMRRLCIRERLLHIGRRVQDRIWGHGSLTRGERALSTLQPGCQGKPSTPTFTSSNAQNTIEGVHSLLTA